MFRYINRFGPLLARQVRPPVVRSPFQAPVHDLNHRAIFILERRVPHFGRGWGRVDWPLGAYPRHPACLSATSEADVRQGIHLKRPTCKPPDCGAPRLGTRLLSRCSAAFLQEPQSRQQKPRRHPASPPRSRRRVCRERLSVLARVRPRRRVQRTRERTESRRAPNVYKSLAAGCPRRPRFRLYGRLAGQVVRSKQQQLGPPLQFGQPQMVAWLTAAVRLRFGARLSALVSRSAATRSPRTGTVRGRGRTRLTGGCLRS